MSCIHFLELFYSFPLRRRPNAIGNDTIEGDRLLNAIQMLSNQYIDQGKIPTSWKNKEMLLLFKKEMAPPQKITGVSVCYHT